MSRRALLVALVVVAIGLFVSSLVPQANAQRDLGETARIVIGELEESDDVIEDEEALDEIDYAVVEVRNNIDRTINVDFSGPQHYELKVGDRTRGKISIEEGTYTVRISASALKDGRATIEVEDGTVYQFEVDSAK
jgi:hypothetical protein